MAKKTAAEHLVDFHKAAFRHHSEMMAAHKSEIEKSGGGFHKTACDSHQAMVDYHGKALAECEKAAADALNKLVPTQVSVVVPTPPSVRAVLRPGQRELPTNIAPELRKILGSDPEWMNSEEVTLHR
jgi:hypothetical protein